MPYQQFRIKNPGVLIIGYNGRKQVIVLVKGVSKEFAYTNITVNGLAPAIIETTMNQNTLKEQLASMTVKIRNHFIGKPLCIFRLHLRIVFKNVKQLLGYIQIKTSLFILFIIVPNLSFSQDVNYARKLVDTLTSPYYWGRGYTKDGMRKAAQFLARQFSDFGLKPLSGNTFFQPFLYPVNTFPNEMHVRINEKNLIPGKDFIISPDSRGVHAKGNLQQQDSTHYVDTKNRIIVSLENKLTWSVAAEPADYTMIQVDKESFTETPETIDADIDNKPVKNFQAFNVCGWVKGAVSPDSVIVISAHYDHLGGMGKDTYFQGANDNASGTSLLLGLAKYYAANPQPFTIAFICFAGEEAGLKGSEYFTQHPLIPLKNIRFLLNLDLEGTGNEGITVVNATEFPKEFTYLNEINNANNYLVKINPRGKAANSDHYWFTEKGVRAFFLYTLGGIKAYHDVFDKAETLPLTEYEDLFKLIVEFNEKLMK